MADEELPPQVASRLEAIEERLREVASGRHSWEVVAHELELFLADALGSAARAGQGLDHEAPADADPLSIGQVIASNVRLLRMAEGWTQADLAEAMQRLGFEWTRITARDFEAGGRRVQLDELFGLAVILEEPVVELLHPHPWPIRWVSGVSVEPEDILRLLLGDGGTPGVGGGDHWVPGSLGGAPAPGEKGKLRREVWRSARETMKR